MPSAKNFAYSTVLTAPSPATSGTSLVVQSADGTKFPAVPFNATVWPAGAQPTTANAEIVTVTGISTDTFTIVRAQEDSSARTVVVGDQIAATATAGVVLQANRFTPVTPATQNITLDGSTDFTVSDAIEIGSGYSIELPATSTLEVVPVVKQSETQSYFAFYDTVESGCVWTADSAGSSLNATMTDGYVWLNGRRLRVNSVRSRAFTASTDTYVDFSNNGDGTAKVTYTETTNNAATGSPALAGGSLRNAIIVSGANIAASTSINQGQETIILPIVSSIPYSVTDSLGNLICPRDPSRKILGYRQITANATQTSATPTQVTGLSCPVIIPGNRKIKISFICNDTQNSISLDYVQVGIWDGTVNTGTRLALTTNQAAANGQTIPTSIAVITTPATASKTYNIGMNMVVGGTATIEASSTSPAFILVELV